MESRSSHVRGQEIPKHGLLYSSLYNTHICEVGFFSFSVSGMPL